MIRKAGFGTLMVGIFLLSLSAQSEKEYSLQNLLEIGFQNNFRLTALSRRAEAGKAALKNARAYANPGLSYQIGKAENYEGTIGRTTHGLSLNQAIENPFKRHYRIQAAESGWKAEEFNFREYRLKLTYEIKKYFFTILWLKREKELSIQNLKSIRDIYQLIARKAELGEIKELEAIKLEVESMKAENQIIRIQTELQSARESLNTFLGKALPEDFIVAGELDYSPVRNPLETLIQTALQNHPLIQKKVKEAEQAEHLLYFARWQRFPDFELSAFTAKDLHGQNQGLGISLHIPLWNFKSGDIARSERLLESHQQELASLELELAADIKNRHARVLLAQKTLDLFHKGLLKQAGESERIARFSYQQGETSLIDYLDSQRTYLQIHEDYIHALYTWCVEKAGLEMAAGDKVT